MTTVMLLVFIKTFQTNLLIVAVYSIIMRVMNDVIEYDNKIKVLTMLLGEYFTFSIDTVPIIRMLICYCNIDLK